MINFDEETIISITIDTDWAPPECVEDTLAMLEIFGIRPTIFATLGTPVELLESHDIGIHPNFEAGAQDTDAMRREISRCLEAFPVARGLRSHALVGSSRLYMLIRDEFPQIEYASNYYIPTDWARPFIGRGGIPELPIFWMDDAHLSLRGEIDRRVVLKNIGSPGLKVFAFHPFHVMINAQDRQHVLAARRAYHNPAELVRHKKPGMGAAAVLFGLCAQKRHKRFLTCSEIAKEMKA